MSTDIIRLDLRMRRRGLWGYGLGMAVYAGLIVALYPTFKNDTSMDALARGNTTMAALFGISGSLTSPAGWMNANLYANFVPLVVLLMTIGYGASCVAGQDEDAQLGLVAALPLSRRSLVTQKAAALAVLAVPVPLVTLLAALLGRRFDLTLPAWPLLGVTVATMLFGLDLGLVALLLGCLTGSRALALAVSASIAALGYLISSLAPVIGWIHMVRDASPFYWAVGNDQVSHGLEPAHALALLLLGAALFAGSVRAFERMDIQ
jgi:ABC-2 type transport system permease protein